MKQEKLVIVGKGAFGDLMARQLRPHCKVAFVRRSDSDESVERKLKGATTVIYSVPMVGLEQSIRRTKPFVGEGALLVDVTSVKVAPLEMLKKHFKHHEILGIRYTNVGFSLSFWSNSTCFEYGIKHSHFVVLRQSTMNSSYLAYMSKMTF